MEHKIKLAKSKREKIRRREVVQLQQAQLLIHLLIPVQVDRALPAVERQDQLVLWDLADQEILLVVEQLVPALQVLMEQQVVDQPELLALQVLQEQQEQVQAVQVLLG